MRFICDACRTNDHDNCPGGTWCDCQHKPRLVDTEVAALALGVAQATVRSLRHRGQLTRYGTRARARYDLAEVEALATRKGDECDAPAVAS